MAVVVLISIAVVCTVGSTDQYLATLTCLTDRATGALRSNIYICINTTLHLTTYSAVLFRCLQARRAQSAFVVHPTKRSFFFGETTKEPVRSWDLDESQTTKTLRFVYRSPNDTITAVVVVAVVEGPLLCGHGVQFYVCIPGVHHLLGCCCTLYIPTNNRF